jgi:hypothetical protein
MATSWRILGSLALVLGLGMAATQSAQAKGYTNPAVVAITTLADNLDRPGLSLRAKFIVDNFDSCDISTIFRPYKNGGAGIGSAVNAGHVNSIQNLVQHWSGPKPPTQEELVTHRHDLLKVARVLKVMSELAPLRLALVVPKNDAKRIEAMHKVTGEFKAVAIELHDAIKLAEPQATRKAAITLNQVCQNCHQVAGN